jgi:hypothetical protein
MAIDTPARIAVLGAGPLGLEAALYARFLGYDVDIYERGDVAENMLHWGHVPLFTPWRQNVSPLAIAALTAQDEAWRPPDENAILTGRQFAEDYLLRLASSDLLSDGLHTHTEVVAVGRQGQLKGDHLGSQAREDGDFRLLLRDAAGQESLATADVVIDATGTFGNHNWAGASGIPAIGERAAAAAIDYGLPDVLGRDRPTFVDKTTLLVGAGYSAATSLASLVELAARSPATKVVWITRRPASPDGPGPIAIIPNDRLPGRDRLARAANALAGDAARVVEYRPGTVIEAIEPSSFPGRWSVRLSGGHPGTIEVDRIIANVGYRPDNRLFAELQVHECYATGGPIKLAAALLENTSADCLDQTSHGAPTLANPEPDFYILGSKSYGRNSQFLLSIGLAQIRDLFSVIADRADLDLYRTIGNLAS